MTRYKPEGRADMWVLKMLDMFLLRLNDFLSMIYLSTLSQVLVFCDLSRTDEVIRMYFFNMRLKGRMRKIRRLATSGGSSIG